MPAVCGTNTVVGKGKEAVYALVERNGRVRSHHVPDVTAKTLRPIIEAHLAGATVVYSNEPFGNTSVCQLPGTPSPNNNPTADAAATSASHELTEAITDPQLNAWFDASGNEIGDLCAYIYGSNTWDAGLANEMWNGRFYELQTEYDNHLAGCVQVGP